MTNFNKETPIKDLSMKSFAQNEELEPIFEDDMQPRENEEDFPIAWDAKFNDTLKEYNEKITELNPLYSSLVPRHKVLVRIFAKELTITPDGLVLPNTQRVSIPTKAGYGTIGEVENPYPYSRKAVVVAVPEYVKDLTPGMLVQLGEDQTRGMAIGAGAGAVITIPNCFTHHSFTENEPPIDPMNPHYGYLLVDSRFIEMIL